MHVIIWGRVDRKLTFEELTAWLEGAPASIGMSPITPPLVVRTEHGLTGIRLIAESHLVADLWYDRTPPTGWVEAFSCKEFDQSVIERAAVEALGLCDLQVTILPRGLEYLTPQTAPGGA